MGNHRMNTTSGENRDRVLEIHVPISPTPLFINRVHYLAASLQIYGGRLGNSPIIVTIGDDQDPVNLYQHYPWSKHYSLEWRWMEKDLFRKYSYFGTRLRRFTYEYNARNVLMLDADTMVTGPIDDLIDHVDQNQIFCGVVANASPVRDEFTWEKLFAAADLGEVPYVCEHTGFNCMYYDENRRFCPPYFNLGVLVSPASFIRKIGDRIFSELEIVMPIEDLFRAQMSLCLAMRRLGIPWQEVSFKYNFVNHTNYLKRFAEEFKDVRIFHYLNKQHIDKDKDFASPDGINQLIQNASQDKVNAKFIELIKPVHARVLADF